jgi:hypothetical protein
VDKFSIITCQTQKASKFSKVLWNMPVYHWCCLSRVSCYSMLCYNVAQVDDLLVSKGAFAELNVQIVFH